ncbi:MAG TPA: toll/interleukin-1 receptor domain-containing protein [Bryobacteraceae bacterium]|nr:toll/interleukin-1 receptor domain-containing protein [Bryobacteraceae bacterium]
MAIDSATAFISYCREDLQFVRRLATDLKGAGAKVWMDKLDLRPGQHWGRAIEDAVDSCSRLLVILSPASVVSQNVDREVLFALDERKEVIPVLYRECRIPFNLRPIHYVDFREGEDYASALEELRLALSLKLQSSTRPAAAGPKTRSKAEATRRAKAEALQLAKAQAAQRARAQAKRRARTEPERRAKAAATRRAKAEALQLAKAEAAQRARAEAKRRAKIESERRAKAEATRRAKAEALQLAKAEAAQRARAEAKRAARAGPARRA